jgi:hypothetical protein
MDESKPPIPPSESRLRSAPERIVSDTDPAPSQLARLDELVAVEQQSRSAQIEVDRDDPSDGSSVAVYYRDEEEVRDGFLIVLRAMGVADVEQHPAPVKPPEEGVKS